MPNSRSMLNFHQSVHRLRYFSQCGPESPANQGEVIISVKIKTKLKTDYCRIVVII